MRQLMNSFRFSDAMQWASDQKFFSLSVLLAFRTAPCLARSWRVALFSYDLRRLEGRNFHFPFARVPGSSSLLM